MNRKAMISIIVPVYNAAEYLTDCIESILGQKDQNIEIILVNDGSGDESGSICRTYKKADSRIKYIEIENSGVSAARNIGMERASGDVSMQSILCGKPWMNLQTQFIVII